MLITLFNVVAAICIVAFAVSMAIYLVTKESVAAIFSWLSLVALVVYTVVALVILR